MGASESYLGSYALEANNNEPYFSMGKNTLKVPMTMHAEIRKNLCRSVRSDGNYRRHSWMYFEARTNNKMYDTDTNAVVFRQESFFNWLFGAKEPGLKAIVSCDTGYTILFAPEPTVKSQVWSGKRKDLTWYKNHYAVDDCLALGNEVSALESRDAKRVYLLAGLNRFSYRKFPAPVFEGMDKFEIDKTTLYPIAVAGRVRKTEAELEVIKYVTKASSEAHRKVMACMKPGLYEYHASSIFQYYCYKEFGCREQGYIPICPSGDRCKILHYGGQSAPNDKKITDGSLCLFDMGAEYHCYLTDITCTFPANGKFTELQKNTYNMVLETVHEVVRHIKPGFTWREARMVCYKTLLKQLKAYGLVKGDVDAMYNAKIHRIFMPHGIGHFIGGDVHDVGGNASYWCWSDQEARDIDWYNDDLEWCPLEETMVLTIEPGCYYNDVLITPAKEDVKQGRYLVAEEIDKYMGIGGVRIEEVFIVTERGCDIISDVPRTVDEIENFMANPGPKDIPFLNAAADTWEIIPKENFPMSLSSRK